MITSREDFLKFRERELLGIDKIHSLMRITDQRYIASCSPRRLGDMVKVVGRGKPLTGIIEHISCNDIGEFIYRVRSVRRNGNAGKRVIASVRVENIEM